MLTQRSVAHLRIAILALGLTAAAARSFGEPPQDSSGDLGATSTATAAHDDRAEDSSKRIFGIIPNYRTSPTLTNYTPLDASTKRHLATEDAFDRGTFVLAGLFATQAQWAETAPSFGHGAAAFGHYYSTALADLLVGDFMTEAIYPVVLHHDPRYFRRGVGSVWTRLGYAVGQIVWTHTDRGTGSINASELLGNATAVAIGNAYYPDGRTLSKNVSRWSWQIGTDMGANILKEFWPDLDRAFGRRHGI